MRRILFFIIFLVTTKIQAQLPLRLPSIISDHAVLQQSANVKFWGWGPGSFQISVICSWNIADTIKVPINADCIWETIVKTPKAGGPYFVKFICNNQILTVKDILIGEVWLCSGQSNMEFNFHWGISDAADTLKKGNNNKIRFFQVDPSYDKYPQSDCKGEWKICDTHSLQDFSSIGYFFGQNINEKIHIPVGLIGSYWGGTCIQAWMPKVSFDRDTCIYRTAAHIEPYGWAAKGASLLYNAMIHPITSYRMKGVIWYQGEANVAKEFNLYGKLFTSMILDWRKAYDTDLPFYYVQIAPYNDYPGIQAALLREQQEKVLSAVPNTGMVAIGDLVDNVTDIHPKNKQEVGRRLANIALKEQYGFSNLQPYSPRLRKFNCNKNFVIVEVSSVGKLYSKGKEIKGFQLAGPDKIFYPANAVLLKNGTIKLRAKQVEQPVAIRYNFTNDQLPDLFDINDLPLLPFRTDNN